MIASLREFIKNLPTLIIAFIMAVSAWTAAVIASDPNELRVYGQPVTIEYLGQDPQMVILGNPIRSARVSLYAPTSIWTTINAQTNHIKAYADLSGLPAGTHQVPIQIQVDAKPVQVVQINPETITLTLEKISTREIPIDLITSGSPSIGYQAEKAVMSPTTAIISGPESLISMVSQLRALVDLTQARQPIQTSATIIAVDSNGDPIDGISLNPDKVSINLPITQKGGYRNVVVKVITQGKLADGYRLTSISVNPPSVTVFSSDPQKVDSLPGYVETIPVILDNLKSDLIIPIELNLPEGITLVGLQQISIQASIDPIESSLTISRIPVDIIGLKDGFTATVAPETVDIIFSGPLPLLDALKPSDIQVTVDLTNYLPGTYQIEPIVVVISNEIDIESILPETIEVVIQSIVPTPTP